MTEAADRIEQAQPRRFRPYPEYRDSGVEWLGGMPTDWESFRLRFIVNTSVTKKEVRELDPETEVSFVPMEAVGEYGGLDLDATKPLSEVVDGYTYFCNGDVIVAKITPCFENGKGALASGLYSSIGFGTTELHVLRPSGNVDARFLLYLTFSDHFRRIGTASMYGAGGQKRISDDFIRNFRHPVPSLSEQRAIAAFLDRETAKIDGLVDRKERLIELLQEKRAALITRAVTRGLDPNAPMKDSGVEWLGEIPAHWEVKKLGYVTKIGNGSTPNRNEARYWVDGSHPWLTSAKINEGVIATADQFVTDVAFRECHLPPVPAGSILVAITAEGQTRGRAALLSIDSTISQHLAYITPSCPEINAGFLVRLFEARYEWLREESSGSGSTRAALTCEFLRSTRLAFPPMAEQRAIAEFLDRETARIDTLIAKVRQAIDYLKEFRTALISAAVTGKIDVREAAS